MGIQGFPSIHKLEITSERTKLTLTAVAASALTVVALFGYQAARRQARSRHVKHDIELQELQQRIQKTQQQHLSQHINAFGLIETKPVTKNPSSSQHDTSLIEEQLARNEAFLGVDGLAKIRHSHVIVVGIGSVGSWAALMLARSGVQHLRLIDPAVITSKDLSCHAAATPTSLGTPKVTALQQMVSHIAPFVHLEPVISEWHPKLINPMDTNGTDHHKRDKFMVVDCLGNTSMDAKLKLIQFCHSRHITIVSALDPGNKVDPTRIQITDISDTFDDPSAKLIRRKLKLLNVDRHLPVAYSIEKPVNPKLIPDHQRTASFENETNLSNIHTQKTPILGSIAAMYGMSLTTYTLLHLADFSAYELPPMKLRDKLYGRIQQEVNKRERQNYHNKETMLDVKQVEYIYEEIWRGKSILTGPQERITLARWDRTQPLSYVNTVCMSKEEARAHDVLPMDTNLRQHYGNDVVDYVENKFEEQVRFEKLFKSTGR